MDYRCTGYCKPLCEIEFKKSQFLVKFREEHPSARNHYEYIKDRDGKYKGEFLKIYNERCRIKITIQTFI